MASICKTKAEQRLQNLLCTPFLFAFKTCDTENKRKNAGDYWKQVKASSPFEGCPRKTSDGRADRCAVLGEHARRLLRDSSVFAAFV